MNEKWKRVFDKKTLERGRAYYVEGRVDIVRSVVSSSESEYTAVVTGTHRYTVQVCLSQDHLRAKCTCPHAQEWSICKHMAAVLFQIEADETNSEKDSWQDILETLPTPVLKQLLIQEALDNRKLREKICSYKGIDENDPMAMHRLYIENLRLQYTYFADYMRALSDYVKTQIKKESRAVAVELIVLLYKEVFLQEHYVDRSTVGDCVRFCLEALKQILQEASPEENVMVYEHILPLLDIPRRTNNELGLEDIVPQLPWTADVLTRYLTWLDEHMNEERLSTRLRFMNRLEQPPEMVSAYLKSRNEPYAEEALLEWYEENEPATAISLLLEARDKTTFNPKKHDISRRLLALYQKIGDKDGERDVLLFMTLELHTTLYLPQLKEMLEPEIWRDVFIQIVKNEVIEGERYRLLADEKMYELLLMEITDTENLELFLRYEVALSKQYPEQTYDILIRLLKQRMSIANNREEYAWVIKKLKRVKKYPNGKERLQELVNGFYVQYSNRRAMKEELAKAGYIYNGEA